MSDMKLAISVSTVEAARWELEVVRKLIKHNTRREENREIFWVSVC